MFIDIEGDVLDRGGNAFTTDRGGVFCKHDDFGEWYDIVVGLWREEVVAYRCVCSGEVGEEV